MPVDDEAIGLVRDHRWLSVKAQSKQLKEAGCTRIFDLDSQDRRDMVKIAGRRTTALVYAFLLANPERTRGMLADLMGVLDQIKASGGAVLDMDSGLNSAINEKAFRAVVADQVRRHNQGETSSARKGKPGRKKRVFSRGQLRLAYDVWSDVKNYPNDDAVKAGLAKIKASDGVGFSYTRAFRKWKGRTKYRKD
jgi:hypothetical protein